MSGVRWPARSCITFWTGWMPRSSKPRAWQPPRWQAKEPSSADDGWAVRSSSTSNCPPPRMCLSARQRQSGGGWRPPSSMRSRRRDRSRAAHARPLALPGLELCRCWDARMSDLRHERPDHAHQDGHHHDHGGHAHEGGAGHDGSKIRIPGLLAGVFRHHSHHASDSIDSALTASSEGMRALKLSLGGLALTAALQLIVVVVSHSVALFADTIHNFADALTAVPLGIAFIVGRRPPTKRYTYGYGRAEDLAGIVILVAIALSSAVAAWVAIDRLVHPHTVGNIGWVAAAGLIGFAGNELVAVYRIRVGRKIGSAALVADGLHARTDGLTSLAVVIGALGVLVGWQLADPIVGLAITVAILFVLRNAARDIYRRLMDAVDPALVGHELRAELNVTVDRDLSVADAHDIAEAVHHQLRHHVPRLADATIHVDPWRHAGGDPHHGTAHHLPVNSASTRPSAEPGARATDLSS